MKINQSDEIEMHVGMPIVNWTTKSTIWYSDVYPVIVVEYVLRKFLMTYIFYFVDRHSKTNAY